MKDVDLTHLIKPNSVVYLIAQQVGNENLSDEEKTIALDELKIKDVDFTMKLGIYRRREDAIAVAKELIKRKPTRDLAVRAAIT